MKILRFYIFKMAASGGRHFEINMKVQNYETQYISQKHAYTCTFDNCNLYYVNNHFMGFQGGTSVVVPYCSCCLCLYFGSSIMLVTYFVNFR